MRIALDAMGGDHAPEAIVEGAIRAAAGQSELEIVLVGNRARIEQALGGGHLPGLDIYHCSHVVGMDESPVGALRRKPDSSIARCWELMSAGKVDAMVSAGHTGAVVAGGLFRKRFVPGVKRPAIAVVLPTSSGPCVLLDVGANVAAKPEHLFQYGVMGSIYARHILKVPNPRIALMNVGTEEQKGNYLVKETHALFSSSHLSDRFVGNIEGRDIYSGGADVIVCDGFVGNIILKVCEGLVGMLLDTTAQELLKRLAPEQHGRLSEAYAALKQRYDYSEYGGAPLLGIDGTCIICHGASGPSAICNAIRVAASFVQNRINDRIVGELRGAHAATVSESQQAAGR